MMNLAYTLTHYLHPQHSNNQKAKLLHTSSLFLLSIFLVIYQVILQALPLTGVKILGYAANISPDEVIRLTNLKRREAGVPELSYNAALSQAAKAKGEHMLANDYWAHIAPDGTEPWKFFTDYGYKYRYAGENLARDFSNPSSAIDAWMASPSHKENMLSSKYKEIGVAVVEGDLNGVETTIIVQLFGTQMVDTTSQVPIAQAKKEVATESAKLAQVEKITPTPTAFPAAPVSSEVTPTVFLEQTKIAGPVAESKSDRFHILLSPFKATKDISVALTFILLVVLIIDAIVVARRKITRVSGRSFAHIAFFGMILTILLLAKAGEIL